MIIIYYLSNIELVHTPKKENNENKGLKRKATKSKRIGLWAVLCFSLGCTMLRNKICACFMVKR